MLVFFDGGHRAEAPIERIGTFVPPVPENTPATCSDGVDNDKNGMADCDDQGSDCCNQNPSCPQGTFCWKLPWYRNAHGSERTAQACADGVDNDGDKFVDCDDFDCCALVTCGPTTACGKR